MPNTLAHIGIQLLGTRAVIRSADVKWIYIGAVVPDAGWILQRILAHTAITAPDLRAYAIAQTSVLFSMVLAAALSCAAVRPLRVLAILSIGVVLHLLLDASEIKWGNGIVIFLPFDWRTVNWGLWWPEQWPIWLITVLGAICLSATAHRAVARPLDIRWPAPRQLAVGVLLAASYVGAPWIIRGDAFEANTHYLTTLTVPGERPGRYVELDRVDFRPGPSGDVLESPLSSQPIIASGIDIESPSVVSVRGRFVDASRLAVEAYHDHGGRGRDIPTYLALAAILGIIAGSFLGKRGRSTA